MAEKHQKKKKGSALKILLVVLLLLVLTVGAAGVFAYNEINGNGGKPGAEVTVSIPQGSGVAAIAKELKEAGVDPFGLSVPLVCGAQGCRRKTAVR